MEKVIDAHAKHMIDNKWVEAAGVQHKAEVATDKQPNKLCWLGYLHEAVFCGSGLARPA